MRRLLLITILLATVSVGYAQRKPKSVTPPGATERKWLRHQLVTLCAPHMAGRGYVEKGREKAATYITRQFREFGLQPVGPDSSYTQSYNFSVNTFPGSMLLQLKKKVMQPGEDFIIDAASPSFEAEKIKVKKVNLARINDRKEWEMLKGEWEGSTKVYVLLHTDTLCKRLGIHPQKLAAELPKGCYIIPQHGKLTWDVATDTIPATVFYVEDTVMPKIFHKAQVSVRAQYLPNAKSENIIGCVPGAVKDTYIVFTAHYDHLGMMGKGTYFPGASDNASGTALMLYLADYYAQHPQHYSMLFIAFSGEEAGLLGSKYFVEHPLVPLANMRFLTNLDIMGDATEGITVINATEYPKEFSLLQKLNEKGDYLPQIKSRGKAPISDHYYFSEAGVPAFFMVSNGGKGYYHDIFDKSGEVSLTNIYECIELLKDFVKGLQQ